MHPGRRSPIDLALRQEQLHDIDVEVERRRQANLLQCGCVWCRFPNPEGRILLMGNDSGDRLIAIHDGHGITAAVANGGKRP